MWEDTVLVPFLKKFDEHPFLVKTKNGGRSRATMISEMISTNCGWMRP